MANKIILKKSSVVTSGTPKAPLIGDLEYGELAINYAAGRLYFKKSDNTIQYFNTEPVYVSSTTPSVAKENDLWWDPDTGTMYINYNDGTSTQWVEIVPQVLSEGPAGTFSLTGNLVVSGDTTISGTLYETSDAALKTDITTIDSACDIVNNLRGINFTWKDSGKASMGMIAQEVEEILPNLTSTLSDGTKVLHYTAIIGLLIEAIKELTKRIENAN